MRSGTITLHTQKINYCVIIIFREESDVRLIENIMSDFLQYLEGNRSRYFTSKNYVEANEDYLAKTASGHLEPIYS